MKSVEYKLILLPNGDIEILKITEWRSEERIYHKSYNLGDKLRDNLLKAFNFWENCYDK